MELRAAFLAGILFFVASSVYGEPTHRTSIQGVVITLHSEKCALSEVANLPRRATWVENGKTFEGCVGYADAFGMLMFFFKDDKSVAIIPVDAFSKVTGV
jgi:hypothetical protein